MWETLLAKAIGWIPSPWSGVRLKHKVTARLCTYGHPVPATLEAIAATGAQVWRTDEHGTVTITFQAGQPVVLAER